MPAEDPNEDLCSLPWDELIGEAAERTCEAYDTTLTEWLSRRKMTKTVRDAWLRVLAVLRVFPISDPEVRPPFAPAELYESLDQAAMRPLAAIIPSISDSDLRARIIDLAWQKRACKYDIVADGVAAYIASADRLFSTLAWTAPFVRLKRALELGCSLGKTALARTAAVDAIRRTIDRVGLADERFYVERLMRLLLWAQEGDAAQMADMAEKIATAARSSYEQQGVLDGGQCQRERAYLEVQGAWLQRAGQDDAARDVAIAIAEAFVRQADGVVVAHWPMRFAVAARFVENAVEQLRRIGGEDARVADLRLRLEKLQRATMEELRAMPHVDPPEEVFEAARSHVAGRPVEEALLALSFAFHPPGREELEGGVRAGAAANRLDFMLPRVLVGPRGTTQASHAGVDDDALDGDKALETEMMQRASEQQQKRAAYIVAPALERLMEEHNLETAFFYRLAGRSGFVPRGRERSYGLGLAAGARGDFDVAAALLFPQFEHAVREIFHTNEVATTTLPNSGIQNELDLNSLLRHEGA